MNKNGHGGNQAGTQMGGGAVSQNRNLKNSEIGR